MNKETIKRTRIINGKTQSEMAKLIGVSINTYIKWETGFNNPSDLSLYKIEQAFSKLKKE